LTERVDSLMTMVTPLPRRLGALAADVSALADNVGTRTTSLDEQLRAVRAEIMFQQRRLTRLALPVAAKPVEQVAAEVVDQRVESLCAAFADIVRGTRDDIKERLQVYLDPLRLAGAGQPDRPILDIGCGRGEWLDLLSEQGLHGYGIDSSTIMVERCVAYGLDARHADTLAHLHGIEDAARSAVTAFHVVEHLPFGTLVDFLDEALRVLIPGGLLILETPNPETMRVGATTFYSDPTHRNPLMPELLRFIVQHRGFAEVEILRLHPFAEGLREPTADVAVLNELLFGPQDFAIVGRRP
jgi:O-antigen chain-terminating methyltransferase